MSTNTINAYNTISYLIELNIIYTAVTSLILASLLLLKPSQGSDKLSSFLRLSAPLSFLGGFYIQLVVLYLFINTSKWGSSFSRPASIEVGTILFYGEGGFISLDFFGLILITLSYLVGFISLTSLSDKSYWNDTKQPLIFNLFTLVVMLYVSCDHLFMFFLYYEFLLIPSFLIVYYASSNRKGIQASIYFLIWTQTGSLMVLAVILYLMQVDGVYYFNELVSLGTYLDHVDTLKLVLFIGFGFKVPLWPLYYWLTKTHVEATGSFSMYLSGFLVKTALFGLYKFLLVTQWCGSNTLLLAIALMGVIISSLQMWSQVDLKKLVALCTVQEMNLLLICFLFGQTSLVYIGVLFCFMHAMLSTMMFFLVDLVQKRVGTRLTTEVVGISHVAPNLAISIVLMCLCFLALPFTLKFTCEFILFTGLLDLSSLILLITALVTNWVAPIAFCRIWYSMIFGTPNSKYFNVVDLDYKEVHVISICVFTLTITSGFNIGML